MTNTRRTKDRADVFLCDGRAWDRGLLIDIGSTFTKVMVIGPDGAMLGRAQAPTTIDDDVMKGVNGALDALPAPLRGGHDWALASSSAAGGLRMASVGLTANLSGRAGALAAFGAGAKVVADEHGFLDTEAIGRIDAATPHLVLLSGGLDGGNSEALLHNARMLAGLRSTRGFIVAGNAAVSGEAVALLQDGVRDVRVVDNVFPRAGEIAMTATREAVRDLFLRHITHAKGLDGMMAAFATECEPTPLAVSRALPFVPANEGPVVFVDLGGATTDVHSLGGVRDDHRAAEVPEPEVMRTVEGDLGMRWGAPGTVEAMSSSARAAAEQQLNCDLGREAERRRETPSFLPQSDHDRAVDCVLAQAGAATAIERHAGKVVVRHRPWGDRYHVSGKDLRPTRVLVATGGVFRHGRDPHALMYAALGDIQGAQSPRDPAIAVDHSYALYAIGLLGRLAPDLARALADQTLDCSIASRRPREARAS
ncbi:MAG: glutamate mutase L [Pseudomonadota bacterium]